MSNNLTISEIEGAIALIAQAIFNIYSPSDLKITVSEYYKIIEHLNKIEKVLQRART